MSEQAIVVRPPDSRLLPDTKTHVNRFEIKSETSGDIYIVAQNRSGRFWSCGCHGWIRWKHCKHLDALRLPGDQRPYEAQLR